MLRARCPRQEAFEQDAPGKMPRARCARSISLVWSPLVSLICDHRGVPTHPPLARWHFLASSRACRPPRGARTWRLPPPLLCHLAYHLCQMESSDHPLAAPAARRREVVLVILCSVSVSLRPHRCMLCSPSCRVSPCPATSSSSTPSKRLRARSTFRPSSTSWRLSWPRRFCLRPRTRRRNHARLHLLHRSDRRLRLLCVARARLRLPGGPFQRGGRTPGALSTVWHQRPQ